MAKARIVISPDGLEVTAFVDEGSFEGAKVTLARFFQTIGAKVTIVSLGETEQHRHDDFNHVHIHVTEENHG